MTYRDGVRRTRNLVAAAFVVMVAAFAYFTKSEHQSKDVFWTFVFVLAMLLVVGVAVTPLADNLQKKRKGRV